MTLALLAIRTIYARRVKLSFRNRAMLFSRIIQPALWITVLGTTFNNMFAGTRPLPGDVDYLTFMGAGVIMMTLIFTSLFGGMSLVWDREFGILKEFLAAPIPRYTIPLGNAFSVATEGLVQSLLIFVIAIPLGAKFSVTILGLLGYVVVALLVSSALYGIAASVASRLKSTQGFMGVMNLLTMPLYFVSSSIYPIQFLPVGLRQFAIASPVTHAVGLVRYYIIGEGASNLEAVWSGFGFSTPGMDAFLSLAYLSIFATASITLSCILFSRTTTS